MLNVQFHCIFIQSPVQFVQTRVHFQAPVLVQVQVPVHVLVRVQVLVQTQILVQFVLLLGQFPVHFAQFLVEFSVLFDYLCFVVHFLQYSAHLHLVLDHFLPLAVFHPLHLLVHHFPDQLVQYLLLAHPEHHQIPPVLHQSYPNHRLTSAPAPALVDLQSVHPPDIPRDPLLGRDREIHI